MRDGDIKKASPASVGALVEDKGYDGEVSVVWLPPSSFIAILAPQVDIQEAEREVAGGGDGTLLALWLMAITLFGFGDTFSSVLAFSRGAYEANRVMGGILQVMGGNIVSFVILKTIVLVVLFFISYLGSPTYRWLIPAITSAVGGFLLTNNLLSYFLAS